MREDDDDRNTLWWLCRLMKWCMLGKEVFSVKCGDVEQVIIGGAIKEGREFISVNRGKLRSASSPFSHKGLFGEIFTAAEQ